MTGVQNFTPCLTPTAFLSLLNQLLGFATSTSIYLLKGAFLLGLHYVWITPFFKALWLCLSHCMSSPYFLALEALPIEPNTIQQPLSCYPVWVSWRLPKGGLQWKQMRYRFWMGHLAGCPIHLWGSLRRAPPSYFWFSINGNTCCSPGLWHSEPGPSPCVLVVSPPSHQSLITPYKYLLHLSSPFSSHSPQPVSKALKIFLLGSWIALNCSPTFCIFYIFPFSTQIQPLHYFQNNLPETLLKHVTLLL